MSHQIESPIGSQFHLLIYAAAAGKGSFVSKLAAEYGHDEDVVPGGREEEGDGGGAEDLFPSTAALTLGAAPSSPSVLSVVSWARYSEVSLLFID